ncbi:TRAP transporter large permease [Syntrophomonas erecta]
MSGVLFLVFFVLVLLGVPIAFSLGVGSIAALLYQGQIPVVVSVQRLFTGIDSFPLMAIPFFIIAGELMNTGGISKRLVDFANTLLGHKKGGLAYVTALASMLFAAVCGSGAATTAAIGGMMIPALVRQGYKKDFSTALQATGGSLGVIIPPSIPMVLFGFASGVSIAELFLAGIIPGIAIGVAIMVVSYFMIRKDNLPVEERTSFKEVVKSFFNALPALLMPAIILGGIFSGKFTPTEAAVIAVVYGVLVGIFVYHELDLKGIYQAFLNSAVSNAVVIMLMAFASTFAWILASEMIPQQAATFLLGIANSPAVFLLLVIAFILFVGTFMETTPAMILLVPILVPIAKQFGVDLIHFGIIMVIGLAIGMITPPLGLTVFVASRISEIPLTEAFAKIMPFLITMILMLVLIAFVPGISLWLPGLFK